uniref:Epidermal patterning factor-like protein n=1 Tax=Nicotiana tabacum TaxID=4097 RepID=A0A1S4CHS9_TOBAC|nr:PREDICTED: EPIDERMAL PATTERNING FACTOR-like protein 8 [Nicotiana tabacum]
MALSNTCTFCLKIVVTLILLLSLTFQPSESVGMSRKMVMGSKPPDCVNKCMNCQPCRATLAIPPRQQRSTDEKDDNYYLLSWKCSCRDELF